MSVLSKVKPPVLLDVNVLIGLLDDESPFHQIALNWFKGMASTQAWATCPIVENGFIRIVSGSKYSGGRSSPEDASSVLTALKGYSPSYAFWPDSISLCDGNLFNLELLHGSSQLTDAYLLGLCKANKGQLATFDKKITPLGIVNPPKNLIQLVSSSQV